MPMQVTREIVSTLFDEQLPIEMGDAYLSINKKETLIGVSGRNSPYFFHELLEVIKRILTPFSDIKGDYDYLYLYFDEEGTETEIHFLIPISSYNDNITIHIHQEWNDESVFDFLYQIKKNDLLKNIINLIQYNLEEYNKDAEKNSYDLEWEHHYSYFHPLDLKEFHKIKEDVFKII